MMQNGRKLMIVHSLEDDEKMRRILLPPAVVNIVPTRHIRGQIREFWPQGHKMVRRLPVASSITPILYPEMLKCPIKTTVPLGFRLWLGSRFLSLYSRLIICGQEVPLLQKDLVDFWAQIDHILSKSDFCRKNGRKWNIFDFHQTRVHIRLLWKLLRVRGCLKCLRTPLEQNNAPKQRLNFQYT